MSPRRSKKSMLARINERNRQCRIAEAVKKAIAERKRHNALAKSALSVLGLTFRQEELEAKQEYWMEYTKFSYFPKGDWDFMERRADINDEEWVNYYNIFLNHEDKYLKNLATLHWKEIHASTVADRIEKTIQGITFY